MNEFSELENQLKRLRPAQPTGDLLARVEKAMAERAPEIERPDNVVSPDRFRINWTLGMGLAAAAALLLLVRVNFHPSQDAPKVASAARSPGFQAAAPVATLRDEFIPSGATQVVYHTSDEGLLFSRATEPPVRRLRSRTRETLQWHNPATGASLRVSYPSEQVELIPVSGQ